MDYGLAAKKTRSCFSSSSERGRGGAGRARGTQGFLQPHAQAELLAAPSSPLPRWMSPGCGLPPQHRCSLHPPSSRNNWEFSNKTFLHWESITSWQPELFVGKDWILSIFSLAS